MVFFCVRVCVCEVGGGGGCHLSHKKSAKVKKKVGFF